MIEAFIVGAVTGLLFMLFMGLRRIPWRHAAIVGFSAAVVFSALHLVTVTQDLDPGTGVLLGALGGSVVQFGFDRGDRERRCRSASILAPPPVSDSNAAP